MDDLRRELLYFEEKYEDILDDIMINFGKYFRCFGSQNMTVIDKEELNEVIKEGDFYFSSAINLPPNLKNELVKKLNSASEIYKKIEYLESIIPERKEKRSLEKVTKQQYVLNKQQQKKRKYKMIRTVILTGTIIAFAAGSFTTYSVIKNHKENLDSNVCVEYTIESGDNKSELEDKYELKDFSVYYHEIDGYERQEAAKNSNCSIYEFLAAGDVIIGRTTKENADRLVEEKGASIISIDEALEKLGENNALIGEFKKAYDGDGNFVFYEIPKTLG